MSKTREIETKIQGAVETVLNAVAGLVSRKNSSDEQATDAAPEEHATSTYAETVRKLAKEKQNTVGPDPAHAPGHRKLNHDGSSVHGGAKVQPQNASALNNAAKADIIHQNESEQRRIISGASIERKGQRR